MPEISIQTDPMPELEELDQLRKDYIWLKANSRKVIRPEKAPRQKKTPEQKKAMEEERRFLVSRIVKLGFMQYKYFDNVLSDKEGDVWDRQHKDRRSVIGKLSAISSMISIAYFDKYGELPPLYGSNRSNYYTEKDMNEFGDVAIRDFIWRSPIDEWTKKSTWDCGMTDKRIPLERDELAVMCIKVAATYEA